MWYVLNYNSKYIAVEMLTVTIIIYLKQSRI